MRQLNNRQAASGEVGQGLDVSLRGRVGGRRLRCSTSLVIRCSQSGPCPRARTASAGADRRGSTAAAAGSRVQQSPSQVAQWLGRHPVQPETGCEFESRQGTYLGFGLDPQVGAYRRLPINVFVSLTLSL